MKWYESEGARARLRREEELLIGKFPGFKFAVDEEERLVLYGTLSCSPLLRRSYEIACIICGETSCDLNVKVLVLDEPIANCLPFVDESGALRTPGGYSTFLELLSWVTCWLISYENVKLLVAATEGEEHG
jgi:hypothetical protein